LWSGALEARRLGCPNASRRAGQLSLRASSATSAVQACNQRHLASRGDRWVPFECDVRCRPVRFALAASTAASSAS
jgi:hypothetical protein